MEDARLEGAKRGKTGQFPGCSVIDRDEVAVGDGVGLIVTVIVCPEGVLFLALGCKISLATSTSIGDQGYIGLAPG